MAGELEKFEKKSDSKSYLDALQSVGIKIRQGVAMHIFGPPMVGKSTLSLLLAKEITQALNLNDVTMIATEPNMDNEEFRNFLFKTAGYEPKYYRVKTASGAIKVIRKLPEGNVVIFDSISAILDTIATDFMEKSDSVEPRTITARTSPVARYLTKALRDYATLKRGVAIVVTHMTSVAGGMKYRGRFDVKPSTAGRAGHYIDYELFLDFARKTDEKEKKPVESMRVITVIANRVNPKSEGQTVMISF